MLANCIGQLAAIRHREGKPIACRYAAASCVQSGVRKCGTHPRGSERPSTFPDHPLLSSSLRKIGGIMDEYGPRDLVPIANEGRSSRDQNDRAAVEQGVVCWRPACAL